MNYAYHLLPLIGTSAAIAVIISAPVSALTVTTSLAPVTEIVKSATMAFSQPTQNTLSAPSPPASTDEPPVAAEDESPAISTLSSIVPVAPSAVAPRLPSPPVPTPRQQSAPQPKSQTVSAPTQRTQPSNTTVAMRTIEKRGAPVTLALQKLSADYSGAPMTNNSRQVSASDIIFQIAIAGLLVGAGSLYYAIMKRQN